MHWQKSNFADEIIKGWGCDTPPLATPRISNGRLYMQKEGPGVTLYFVIKEDPSQFLGSEILEENYLRSLRVTAYENLDIWSLRNETKLQKNTKL